MSKKSVFTILWSMIHGIGERVYILGIGGISLSAIAMILKHNGHEVDGYDLNPSKLTEKLQKNGVDDFLVVAECINQRNDSYLSADVFEIRNHELFCGENITKNIEKELPNLENVYLEAKQNMHSVSNGFFSLLNTLRGNF